MSLVYATPDGERYVQLQVSASGRGGGADVTREVAIADRQSVDDPERARRYASEAERMAERHDPNETM